MNQNIKIERLFNLGNYSNITFTDELNDIPGNLKTNEEFITKYRLLQMLEMELYYRQYGKLLERLSTLPFNDAIAEIQTGKANLLDELNTLKGEN